MIGKHFADRYRIIPNGVDCAFFGKGEPIADLADGKRNILFLGRLEKRKGLPFLLEAYAKIKPVFPDTRLVVVGGDGGLRSVCELYVERNRLQDVVFTGYVSDEAKPDYYKTADVYCAPNTGGESMGIVLLEALAAGAPIVASRIEGFSDVITDGEEGFLAPPRDSDALADALKRLLSDQPLRTKMSRQAVKTARDYDWKRVSKQIVGYYEECMPSAPGEPITLMSGLLPKSAPRWLIDPVVDLLARAGVTPNMLTAGGVAGNGVAAVLCALGEFLPAGLVMLGVQRPRPARWRARPGDQPRERLRLRVRRRHGPRVGGGGPLRSPHLV